MIDGCFIFWLLITKMVDDTQNTFWIFLLKYLWSKMKVKIRLSITVLFYMMFNLHDSLGHNKLYSLFNLIYWDFEKTIVWFSYHDYIAQQIYPIYSAMCVLSYSVHALTCGLIFVKDTSRTNNKRRKETWSTIAKNFFLNIAFDWRIRFLQCQMVNNGSFPQIFHFN